MDNGQWTIDNYKSIPAGNTIIVHCQFSIVNYNLLVVLVLRM